MAYRILHVDDDPDIREIFAIALAGEPGVTVASCADARAALVRADEWQPDTVVCDMMMPGMNGATFLTRLRENPGTRRIPVIFMTGRTRTEDIAQLKALGAAGIITKPFDPMTLAASVCGHARPARCVVPGYDFHQRLRTDAHTLAHDRDLLRSDALTSSTLEALQECAHKLAGAAGTFGYAEVSAAARALERAVRDCEGGRAAREAIAARLAALLEGINRELEEAGACA